MDHRAAYTALRARWQELPENDRPFAQSLLNQAATRALSEKQWAWVVRLVERLDAPAKPQAQPVAIDASGIQRLFDSAALKRKAVVLTDGEHNIRISVAGEGARYPGSLNVTTANRSFEGRDWIGRVREGRFEVAGKAQGSPLALAATTLLGRFAADPAGVAAEFGRLTGSCSFCARPLDDQRSVEVGYGPICAKRWGLPWGSKQRAA